jgi:tape measure domain-containing protein
VNQSSTVDLIVRFSQPLKAFRAVDQAAKKTNQTLEKTQDVLRKVTEASRGVKASVEATQQSLPKLSQVQGVLAAKVRNSEQAMRSQIKALRDLQVRVKFNGSLYNKLGDEIAKYETKLRSANRTAENAKKTNNGLAAGLRRLAIGFGAARAAQATLQAGIRRDESERRLRLLTQRFGETAEAQAAAQRAADKFNLSQTEANVQLSRLIARLRPMGLSMQTIETAFAGFNTATILAGATASESAGAFLQLSQALGSGVLRGQELNSILEQAPLIAQAIALEMGVTVGALKKLGEEGEITSEIVIAALGRVEREGAGQLADALKGPAAAIKDFQNAVEDVQVALSREIVPEMAASFRELATLIENLDGPINYIGGLIAQTLGQINSLIDQATKPAAVAARRDIEAGRNPASFVNALTFRDTRKGVNELFGAERVQELIDTANVAARFGGRDRDEALVELFQKELGMFAAPAPPDKTKPKPKPRPTALSSEEKRRLEKIDQQRIAAKDRFFQSQEELAILRETNSVEKIRLQFASKRAKVQRDFATLFSQSLSEQERGNLVAALRGELEQLSLEQNQAITNEVRSQFDAAMKFNGQLVELIPETNKLSEEFKSMADTINNEIITGIQGMIEGTKTLGQVASSMLRKIANQMLETAIMGQKGSGGIGGMLLSAVGSFFGAGASTAGPGGFTIGEAATPMTSGLDFSSAFAKGGRPPVGKAALVGERGPELFVPDRAGTIIPNGAMGSTSVVVNVDASGTEVQGNQGNADQLGRLIGQAVQAELIKQKRPGGLLTR